MYRMEYKIISSQTAILAKLCGFNKPTYAFYFKNYNAGLDLVLNDFELYRKDDKLEKHNDNNYTIERFAAPLQSEILDWLLIDQPESKTYFEVENIIIENLRILYKEETGNDYNINNLEGGSVVEDFKVDYPILDDLEYLNRLYSPEQFEKLWKDAYPKSFEINNKIIITETRK